MILYFLHDVDDDDDDDGADGDDDDHFHHDRHNLKFHLEGLADPHHQIARIR